MSWKIGWENLLEDQRIFHLLIILLIPLIVQLHIIYIDIFKLETWIYAQIGVEETSFLKHRGLF